MTNLRTSHMDSQRYDFSVRRQPSCLNTIPNATVDQHSLTLSAHEAIFQSPRYTGEPLDEHCTTIPSERTSLSDDTLDTRNPYASRTSLAESSTSTLPGDLSPPTKTKSAHKVQPSLRKSKSSVGRILCGLDCTRSTTYMLGDDLEEEKDKEIPTQYECNPNKIPTQRDLRVRECLSDLLPLFKPGKEICFTDTYVHEDGHTTTRTIIRPRSRSRSRSRKLKPHGTVQGGLARMRSFDCLRGSNAFEDELDSILSDQTSKNRGWGQQQQQQMRLRVHEEHTVIAEEKWRSAVQYMLYQNAQPVHSIKSHVEVDW